jgi:hypothetical protein
MHHIRCSTASEHDGHIIAIAIIVVDGVSRRRMVLSSGCRKIHKVASLPFYCFFLLPKSMARGGPGPFLEFVLLLSDLIRF